MKRLLIRLKTCLVFLLLLCLLVSCGSVDNDNSAENAGDKTAGTGENSGSDKNPGGSDTQAPDTEKEDDTDTKDDEDNGQDDSTDGSENSSSDNSGTDIGGDNTDDTTPDSSENKEDGVTALYSVGLEYRLNKSEDSYSVVGIGSCTDTDIIIPDVNKGLPVRRIDSCAFLNCTTLTSIDIPDSITAIGDFAFQNCVGLTGIDIPDGVIDIGEYAFSGCCNLKSIAIPACVEKVGYYAFSGCWGDAYNDYGGVRYLGNSENPYLVLVYVKYDTVSCVIHKDTKIVMESAFNYCSNLVSATVNVENEFYKSVDGNLYSKDGKKLVRYVGATDEVSFAIPDGVTVVGERAFEDAELVSISFPNSVNTIGEGAFSGCSDLKQVHISDIAAWCNISLTGDFGHPLTNGAELYLNGNILTEVVIPYGVTAIGDFAFWGCATLMSVEISNSVASIGREAFCGCTSLASIEIPDSVTSIGQYAFAWCSDLISVEIGKSVESIGYSAFTYCTGLKSIVIYGSTKIIDVSAFFGCWIIESVYYGGGVSDFEEAFAGVEYSGLTSATIYYYSESQPIENEYNYWYCDENENIVVW